MKPHVQNEETSVQTSVFLLGIALVSVCACIYIVSRPTTTIPTTPAFSLSVCTFFIGFVIGREARTLYIYIIYIGAATINGAGHIASALLLLILRTRGRSANE